MDVVARFQQIVDLCEWFVHEAIEAPGNLNQPSLLILARMAKLGGPLNAGQLRTKGLYAGSNVNYNLKCLIAGGYISSAKSRFDRRTVMLTLTEKGWEIGTRAAEVIKYIEVHIGSVFSAGDFAKAKGFLGQSLHTDLVLTSLEHRVEETT